MLLPRPAVCVWLLGAGSAYAWVPTPQEQCVADREATCEVNGIEYRRDGECPKGQRTVRAWKNVDCGVAPVSATVVPNVALPRTVTRTTATPTTETPTTVTPTTVTPTTETPTTETPTTETPTTETPTTVTPTTVTPTTETPTTPPPLITPPASDTRALTVLGVLAVSPLLLVALATWRLRRLVRRGNSARVVVTRWLLAGSAGLVAGIAAALVSFGAVMRGVGNTDTATGGVLGVGAGLLVFGATGLLVARRVLGALDRTRSLRVR